MRKIVADYIIDFKLIRRNVHLFLIGGIQLGILAAFMQLLLNLYFKDTGHGEAFIGRVLSFGAFGGLCSAIPCAYLVSRFNIKPLLVISTALYAISFFVVSIGSAQWLILTAAFCFGLMQSVKNVASAPFIMRNTTERERTLVFSLNFSTWVVAGIIGSLLGGWIHDFVYSQTASHTTSYRFALIVSAVIGFLAIIPLGLIKSQTPPRDEVGRAFSWKSLNAKKARFLKIVLPFVIVGSGAGLIIPFLNLYFKNRFHLEPERIGIYFSILQVTTLLAVLIVPILKKKLGYINTIVLTELLSIPFMLTLCYTQSLQMAFWAFLFRGALMNMGNPIITSFIMESVEPEDHGLINSLSSTAWAGSWAISTQVGGVMIEKGGFVGVFQIAIALYVISAFFYFYYFGKCESRVEERIIIDPAPSSLNSVC